uniref:Uncharacterized protein n=1 Tax=Fervidobacterium nodosum TaxID=2424 RepID=A0A7C5U881_9BACT
MVRPLYIKLIFILLTFSVFAVLLGNNLYIYFEKNVPSTYEGVNVSTELKKLFYDVPTKTLRVVHVVSIFKETYTRKVTEFLRDPQGTYVYYKGSYYYTSSRARYKYDSGKKTYIQDPRGSYVYLSDFPWARKEEDKYIISDFYRRYDKNVSEVYYYLSLYVVDIDIEKIFVKSMTPILSVGNTFKEAVEKSAKLYSENTNIYSPDKIDIVVTFNRDFDKLARIYILASLQEDTRYNIYDRSYLNELFKIISLEDLLGKGVNLSFRPPKYVFSFENYTQHSEKTTMDKYYFFENPVNGQYIKKRVYSSGKLANQVPVKVEVGRYYSYDSKNKSYVLDMKDGSYVKYYKAPWETESYVIESTFYDYIFKSVEVFNFYVSFLVNVLDTERGTIIGSKSFDYFDTTTLKEPIDRFGSEDTNSEYLTQIASYKSLSSSVKYFLQEIFPLSSIIGEISGTKITLLSGENIGVKRGYVFQGINDGFTMGYFSISKVYKSTSDAQIFYILPSEQFKKDTIAFETKKYPTNMGLTMRIYGSTDMFGIEAGYTNFDIFGNYNFGILFGYGYKYSFEGTEELGIYHLKVYSLLTQNFDVFLSGGIDLSDYTGDELVYNFFASTGIRISSYQRESIFSFGGTAYYAEIGLRVTFGDTLQVIPQLILGLEIKY